MLQAGKGVFLASGHFAVIDEETGQVRIVDAHRVETGRVGGKGKGPGEFGPFATLWRWTGDTLAVHDYAQARISLYTPTKFVGSINLSEPATLITAGFFGRLSDKALAFGMLRDRDQSSAVVGAVRMPQSLVAWSIGASDMRTLTDALVSTERYLATFNGKPGFVRVNFAKTTSVGVLASSIAIYDDALPVVKVLLPNGKLQRVIRLSIKDVEVNAAEKDSVLNTPAMKRGLQSPDADVRKLLEHFPPTRPNAKWMGVDDGGFWLALTAEQARTQRVNVRFDIDGRPTHCYRAGDEERVLALYRDRVAVAITQDAGDRIEMRRAVTMPRP